MLSVSTEFGSDAKVMPKEVPRAQSAHLTPKAVPRAQAPLATSSDCCSEK